MRRRVVLSILVVLLAGAIVFSASVRRVEASATIYIRANGSIDPPTASIQQNGNVYTLTGNITSDADGLIVERDNIVVDGSGFTVEGAHSSHGVYLYGRSNVTIQNANIKNFSYGILLYTASYNRILGNNITNNNEAGAWLAYSSNYNSINGNNITNNWYGIGFGDSSSNGINGNMIANNSKGIWLAYVVSNYNSISGNTVTNNGEGIELDSASSNSINGNTIKNNNYGIVLHYSSNYNSISGNTIKNNGEGIGLYDSSSNNHVWQNTFIDDSLYVQYPYPNSVENNTVNGRPLVYLESVADYSVGDAGQVILVRCTRIKVENLNLSQTSTGVQLWETNNCIFSGNTITTNRQCGIELFSSSNNSISKSNITNNSDGIWIHSSSNNSINGNNITNNTHEGIWLDSASNNRINVNTIEDNAYGIWLHSSSNNSIGGNTITNNYVGIFIRESSNNSLGGNTVTNNGEGIWLDSASNNSINGNNIIKNDEGIWLDSASNYNSIGGNNITNNGIGFWLTHSSDHNSIDENIITNNRWYGIGLDSASGNSINGNNIANNGYGIGLYSSSDNSVYRNNFLNNAQQFGSVNSRNAWDDGYPSGGNYWSNYAGLDLDHDGIGDAAQVIDANNTDNYPLMGMFFEFNVTYFTTPLVAHACNVTVISNSSVSDFVAPIWIEHPEVIFLKFNVTGEEGSTGFCRVFFPAAMMNRTYHVFVSGTEVPHILLPCSNADYSYLYFTYTHSTKEVVIIPEFPIFFIISLFMTATLLAALVFRRSIDSRASCEPRFEFRVKGKHPLAANVYVFQLLKKIFHRSIRTWRLC